MSLVKPTDPQAFVDWIGVTQTLQHAATGQVRTVMLLDRDGSLLAIGHGTSQSTGLQISQLSPAQQYIRAQNDNVTSSLISTIWQDYQEFGAGQSLTTVNLDFENGQIAITSIGSRLLLCFVASHNIQPGMLRGKMMTISHSLHELVQLYPSDQ